MKIGRDWNTIIANPTVGISETRKKNHVEFGKLFSKRGEGGSRSGDRLDGHRNFNSVTRLLERQRESSHVRSQGGPAAVSNTKKDDNGGHRKAPLLITVCLQRNNPVAVHSLRTGQRGRTGEGRS